MSKIILSGYIIVPENDLEMVRKKLPEHIKNTQQEQGCLAFKIEEDPENPCKYLVYEEFRNKAAFEFHQARAQDSAWGQASSNVKRHFKIYENDYGTA